MPILCKKNGLDELIDAIENSPEINSTGIRNKIEKTLKDKESLAPAVYRELQRFYKNLHPEVNKLGALMGLYAIRK